MSTIYDVASAISVDYPYRPMEPLGETVCYCKGCDHEHERIDRDRCAKYADCRRPKSGPIDCWHGEDLFGVTCEFPGCSKPAKKLFNDCCYCLYHHETVRRRHEDSGWPAEKLHDPIQTEKIRIFVKKEPVQGRDFLICEECGQKKMRPRGISIDEFMGRKYCSRTCSNRGRAKDGLHNRSKLTADDIRAIRALHPKHSYRRLAARYGMSSESIRLIVKRKTFAGVE